jgi:hypothetical protein
MATNALRWSCEAGACSLFADARAATLCTVTSFNTGTRNQHEARPGRGLDRNTFQPSSIHAMHFFSTHLRSGQHEHNVRRAHS